MEFLLSWSTFFCCIGAVLATPESALEKHPKWAPPGPNDVRSPCPLLNSLANHDILPHDGKDITIPILKRAFKEYINVGHDVAKTVGSAGIALSPKPNSNSFDLDDLDKHNAIEHDGSISRDDYYFDHNDHAFNHTVFNQAAVFFQKKTITPSDAAKARQRRHSISRRTNPHYQMSKEHFEASFTEAAFYLSVFGDPYTGIVPDSRWIKYWFRERRLPYMLGWTPREQETNLTTLPGVAKKVQKATPKKHMPRDFEFSFVPH